MSQIITLSLSPRDAANSAVYRARVAREMRVREDDIALLRIVKRSVDARRGALKVNLTLEAFIDNEPMPAPLHFDYPSVAAASSVIIVGAGDRKSVV